MTSYVTPDLPTGFGVSDHAYIQGGDHDLGSYQDDAQNAHSALGDPLAFGGEPSASHHDRAQDELFGESTSLESSLSSAFTSRDSVSELLRERISRAASREHSHSLGQPHSILGATPQDSSPQTTPTMRDDTIHAPSVSWGTGLQADAGHESPEPEPFRFESPTRLSTDEHLAMADSDVEMEMEMDGGEPEVPETSPPALQGVEEHQEAMFEQTILPFTESIRDRLALSARAASVILGEDANGMQQDRAPPLFDAAPYTNGYHPSYAVEEAVIDDEEDEQAPDEVEDAVRTLGQYTDAQPLDEPATETRISTITTIERVPLKRSVDDMPPEDPSRSVKRRRRRSLAEMLEAETEVFIRAHTERARRHTFVPASVVALDTPRQRRQSVGPGVTPGMPRPRGRPRKSDSVPLTRQASATPRPRGRPRKSDTALKTTPGLKKQTGFDPEVSTGVDPLTWATPRGRGRPPKSAPTTVSGPRPKTPVSTGRKRGRPSLASKATAQSPTRTPLVADEAGVVQPKRGRGRPPKATKAVPTPKSPGPVSLAIAAEDGEVQPKQRGRGRPRTQKLVEEVDLTVEADEEEALEVGPLEKEVVEAEPSELHTTDSPTQGHTTQSSLPPWLIQSPSTKRYKTPRRRQQEPSVPPLEEATTPKRRPGRPPKSTLTPVSTPTSTVPAANTSKKRSREAAELSDEVLEVEAKKLRTEPQVAEADVEIVESSSVRRGRGRPPKKGRKSAATAREPSTHPVAEADTSLLVQDVPPVRRGRGRPKKT